MITLYECAKYFKSVSFLLYPTEVKRLKCAMLGAFTVRGSKFKQETDTFHKFNG